MIMPHKWVFPLQVHRRFLSPVPLVESCDSFWPMSWKHKCPISLLSWTIRFSAVTPWTLSSSAQQPATFHVVVAPSAWDPQWLKGIELFCYLSVGTQYMGERNTCFKPVSFSRVGAVCYCNNNLAYPDSYKITIYWILAVNQTLLTAFQKLAHSVVIITPTKRFLFMFLIELWKLSSPGSQC